jgi:hypothetical protein
MAKRKVPPKVRVSLDLPDRTAELMEQLAEGSTKTAVVCRAIELLGKMRAFERDGKVLALTDGKGQVTRLLPI